MTFRNIFVRSILVLTLVGAFLSVGVAPVHAAGGPNEGDLLNGNCYLNVQSKSIACTLNGLGTVTAPIPTADVYVFPEIGLVGVPFVFDVAYDTQNLAGGSPSTPTEEVYISQNRRVEGYELDLLVSSAPLKSTRGEASTLCSALSSPDPSNSDDFNFRFDKDYANQSVFSGVLSSADFPVDIFKFKPTGAEWVTISNYLSITDSSKLLPVWGGYGRSTNQIAIGVLQYHYSINDGSNVTPGLHNGALCLSSSAGQHNYYFGTSYTSTTGMGGVANYKGDPAIPFSFDSKWYVYTRATWSKVQNRVSYQQEVACPVTDPILNPDGTPHKCYTTQYHWVDDSNVPPRTKANANWNQKNSDWVSWAPIRDMRQPGNASVKSVNYPIFQSQPLLMP
jgi:hypothetical protein